MGRRLSAAVVAFAFVATTLWQGKLAVASPQWCEEDPVFVVNGATLDVTTGIPSDAVDTLSGPIEFELLVPVNATAAVLALPSTIPATAKVTKSLPATGGLFSTTVPVVVRVSVPARGSFDTQTRITGTYGALASTVWGKSNVTTKVSYALIGL
jgi:hypothetical protein